MRTSSCSCGECKVEVEGDPTLNGLCNCDDCRRRTGAPFSWSVYFPNDAVRKVEGPLTTRVVEFDQPAGEQALLRKVRLDAVLDIGWRR